MAGQAVRASLVDAVYAQEIRSCVPVLLGRFAFRRHDFIMDEKDIDHDEMIYWLMEIERKQKLIAIMFALFGTLWGFSKFFPVVARLFIG